MRIYMYLAYCEKCKIAGEIYLPIKTDKLPCPECSGLLNIIKSFEGTIVIPISAGEEAIKRNRMKMEPSLN